MAESKEDSLDDLSRDMKKVSFAEPLAASPQPATTSISAAAAAAPTVSFVDKGWPDQEAAGIDYASLTPLSPVVMHRQATINIGTIGHVAHGKSTVVKAISGVQTVRFKTELERNITIKLGYANAKIYRCNNTKCPRPGNYKSYGSAAEASPLCQREGCGGHMELQRHVSFVDCFGLDTRVRMADGGVRRVDELRVGDGLMGPDGDVRTVLGSVVRGVKEMYGVAYGQKGDDDERRSFSCTGGHLLVLRIDQPVDAPFFQPSNQSYAVRVLSADTAGIESNLHTFAAESAASLFYSQCDHSPIDFEMTVDSYRIAPSYITDKARLFYCPPLPTRASSILCPPLPNKSLFSSSRPFSIRSIGPQPFFGFETDGDQRVMLDDGLVVHNCPGHDILMATMLNGAAVMDAAMLLIAGNESCWPVDDTRILTDRGYLFFEDIKELEQRGEQPLFACYDSKSASLVFRPRIGRLVRYEHNGSIVDFTHTAERPRWAADSTPFGASSAAPSTVHTGGHFTLRVTPEHAVFTQHGKWQGNNQWLWSAFGGQQAGTAAPTQSSTAIRMLTRAAGGGTPETDESAVERELLAMFGVSGTAACDAFLELYGFWLGDGSLDVHNQRVVFISYKEDDVAWLRATLPKTGLPADSWYENPQKETGVRFAIGPWFAPFFDEYADKYTVSTREYSETEDEDMSGRPSASSSSASVYKIEAPNVASAKWFWYWLRKRASRRQLRRVVAGLHRADGSFSSERGEIYTSSVRFRDELLAVLTSAGYTASFSLKRRAGAVSSYIAENGAQGKRTLTPQAFAELTGDQQRQYRAVRAKSCSWRVQFSEYEAVALREADVQSRPFKGAVWCLTVDHPEHLVVVQRAHRVQEGDKWIVTKAGAPVIVGQCPQPQTSEHLAAVEIMKLKHLLILQNKIDLVKEKEAASQYDEILNFIRGTVADGSPIIPISAQLKYNIDVACEYICKKIPVPVRDFSASPQLIVIRSFDVNKPGEEVDNLKGGVAGGSILKGVLRIGQEIEIRPGIVTKDKTGGVRCLPIKSRIVSLYAEHNDLHFAVPGGLIGVGTKIDPTLTRADRLVGQVLGDIGKLPDIFTELEISFFLLRRLLGVKTDGEKKKAERIKKLMKGEILMVNIGSTSTGARILQVKGDLAKVVLTSPVCTSEGEKLALSRRVEKHWRLIGWGKIRKGTKIVASESAGSGGTSGLGVGVGVTGDEGGVDEMDELSKEADRAGEGEQEDDEDDEEEKD